MDEFDQNRVSQQAFLKHILQKPVVNVRRPHGTATQEMRRYASFIGTSNHKDLLTDTSGSRRYIVINVTGPIDCSPIDYEQLYAQAMHDLYRGERYWFNTEDENVMTENNQEFQVMPVANSCFTNISEGQKKEKNASNSLPLKYCNNYNMTARFMYLSAVLSSSEEYYKRTKYLLCIRNAVISTK